MKHDKNLPNLLLERLKPDEVAIFLFHGVIKKQVNSVRNYTGKHIEEKIFEDCMIALSKKGKSLSMDEILFHYENKIPFSDYSYSITFDDGFENNISVAAPILKKYAIKSMVYITTDFIESNKMSWIDRIEYAVENTNLNKYKKSWKNEYHFLNNKESKISLLKDIRKYVKSTKTIDPNKFANNLCKALGFDEFNSSNDILDKKLNWEQIKEIINSKFMSIGAHTHSHNILSFLSKKELQKEIDISLKLIKEKTGLETIHFSYPEGLSHCFSEREIVELSKRGIRCCPTAIDGTNKYDQNPFHLKRIMVG